MALAVVILAAGDGTRMRSAQPKVLHRLAGAPMIGHVLKTAAKLDPDRIILITGPGHGEIVSVAGSINPDIEFAVQPNRLGTGDAVTAARPALKGFEGQVLVLYGDTPMLRHTTARRMISEQGKQAHAVFLGFRLEDPSGYGRLICDNDGALERIVEHADANTDERLVNLCNSGALCADSGALFSLLEQVRTDNSAGEFYLTDIAAIANEQGLRCKVVEGEADELLGVNSRSDLARAEAAFQKQARQSAFESGATLVAAETVFFGLGSTLGSDVVVEPHVVIGPGVAVEDGATIRSFSHLEECRIGKNAIIGPFARIRPATCIGDNAKVGNFVEIKASTIGKQTKVPHLSYVGDAEVGTGVNVGAGTITCNYDGVSKHVTRLGDGAFIGSNSTIIAPVEISDHAMTAAGSVITQDVPERALALARSKQRNLAGAAARLFERLRGTAGKKTINQTGTITTPTDPAVARGGNRDRS